MGSHSIRSLVRESRLSVHGEIDVRGVEAVFRTRIRRMAESGDLYLIRLAIENLSLHVSQALLMEISELDTQVARGKLIGLRDLWRGLVDAGEEAGEEKAPDDLREVNPLQDADLEDYNPLEMDDQQLTGPTRN